MIDYREDAQSGLVEIIIDGKITTAEFEVVAAKLEAWIAAHGKVRLLEEVRSFTGMEPAAFWRDLKFGLRHLNDFSRCAVVTDARWMEWLAKAFDPITPCELKAFEPEQIDQARAWLVR